MKNKKMKIFRRQFPFFYFLFIICSLFGFALYKKRFIILLVLSGVRAFENKKQQVESKKKKKKSIESIESIKVGGGSKIYI